MCGSVIVVRRRSEWLLSTRVRCCCRIPTLQSYLPTHKLRSQAGSNLICARCHLPALEPRQVSYAKQAKRQMHKCRDIRMGRWAYCRHATCNHQRGILVLLWDLDISKENERSRWVAKMKRRFFCIYLCRSTNDRDFRKERIFL